MITPTVPESVPHEQGEVPVEVVLRELDPGILDLSARAVFVPVRHHSPACARMVLQLARELKPAVILIEGPSDFNERIHEVFLPHRLPIAVYTYVRSESIRRGAYYPFCVYSPEWQALQVARELDIPVRFIDLPWAEMVKTEDETAASHLYADGELRASDFITALCERVGVEGFDALWDTLFEIDPDLPVPVLLERCHRFCYQARVLDRHVPEQDLRREAFMAQQVRKALEEFPGQALVVTGGFHSSALHRLVNEDGASSAESSNVPLRMGEGERGGAGEASDPQPPTPDPQLPSPTTGIALTPYSYERLDSLTGYDAGMPNPGFYHQVWENRAKPRAKSPAATHRKLLAEVVRELRKRGQRFSTADLIAVETTAQALASIRAHEEVWRADLIDGILGALVKDELEQGLPHPFLQAVYAVFRGGERGALAEGSLLPPLVHDVRGLLKEHDLEPASRERTVELTLTSPADLIRSRILHQLGGLAIPGYDRIAGTDFAARTDLSRYEEQWRIRWSPEFEAGCIESAVYGPSLLDAAAARLRERADAIERNAEQGARLLLEARLMGLEALTPEFQARLVELIREDGGFLGVTGALGHLVYLYRYDEIFGATGDRATGELLVEAWSRGLWLLESLGRPQEEGTALLNGIRALVQTWEACGESCGETLALGREELLGVLQRLAGDDAQSPLLRGGATGALWTLGETDPETILSGIRYCAQPDRLGDYLTGLFVLARETIQRHQELVVTVDALLMAYSDDQYLEALPALRLAFSYFTPREKHYLARTLLEALGITSSEPLTDLQVDVNTAARALSLEAGVFRMVELYGLRG